MSSIFSKKETRTNKPKRYKKIKNENEINDLSDDDNDSTKAESSISLSLDDIIKSIPPNATIHPNEHLRSTHTEWRWRFFEMKERKLVEISKKTPDSDRIYMNNTGKWISNFELEGNWDKFLTDTRYFYGK